MPMIIPTMDCLLIDHCRLKQKKIAAECNQRTEKTSKVMKASARNVNDNFLRARIFSLFFVSRGYKEDIYCFVNRLIFHECVARVTLLIFPIHEMKYFCYLPKKIIFSVKGEKLYFFHSHFSLTLLDPARLEGIILGVNAVCT